MSVIVPPVTIAGPFGRVRGRAAGPVVAAVIAALALAVLGGAWLFTTYTSAVHTSPLPVAAQPIVLISGRDDHGLLRDHYVPLYAAPGGQPAAAVHDGTLAHVTASRGQWLRVRTVERQPQEGWIDDYYLRSRALRLDGGGQVSFSGAEVRDGQIWAAVRPVGAPEEPVVWLPLEQLVEVGARDR